MLSNKVLNSLIAILGISVFAGFYFFWSSDAITKSSINKNKIVKQNETEKSEKMDLTLHNSNENRNIFSHKTIKVSQKNKISEEDEIAKITIDDNNSDEVLIDTSKLDAIADINTPEIENINSYHDEVLASTKSEMQDIENIDADYEKNLQAKLEKSKDMLNQIYSSSPLVEKNSNQNINEANQEDIKEEF